MLKVHMYIVTIFYMYIVTIFYLHKMPVEGKDNQD